MSAVVNEEVVNDTAKLAMHRLIARALARDPTVLATARGRWRRMADRHPDRSFVDEWGEVLSLPDAEIRALLVRRDERMTRLRLSSPFTLTSGSIDLTDVSVRRRIWKLARRVAIRSAKRSDERHVAPGMVV